MNAQASALLARLTEVERMRIRRETTEDGIIGLYHAFKPELPGGNLHGGTEAAGIKAMQEVHAVINERFIEGSKIDGFGNTWLVLMLMVHYENGVDLTYDDELSVGSFITTSHEGYHVLTQIEFREQATPIFHYVKVLTADGKPSRAFNNSCDASYCHRVDRAMAKRFRDEAVLAANQCFDAMLKYT